MDERRTVDIDEFADAVLRRLSIAEARIKGLHIVLNAAANAVRDADPALASELADRITHLAVHQDTSEDVQELVRMYVAILTHGRSTDPSGLQ